MGYLFLVIFFLAIVVGLAFVRRALANSLRKRSASDERHRGELSPATLQRFGLAAFGGQIVLLGILALVTFTSSLHEIPTGNVGVVYSFNRIVGQTDDGLQFTLPWQTVRNATAQVQGHNFANLSSFSRESQVVDVAATLNISVSRTRIQELYRNVGPNYFEVLVAPRVRQAFKDETVRYAATDIAPHREDIRRAVRERLVRELSANSITVQDLLIDDISFSPAFQASIEEKQVRTQNALMEQAGIAVAQAQAQQEVERQRGIGAAALARATQEAEANRQVAASLTPALVQYRLNERIAPNVQVMVVPAGQPLILNAPAPAAR